MSRKAVVAAVSACVLALMVGCAKAPQQKIDAANAAVQKAQAAQADVYAAPEFQTAKAACDQALAEVAKQNKASALSRNYAAATKLLDEAIAAAGTAEAAVAAGKAKVKAEAEATLKQAEDLAAPVAKLVADAKKAKKDVTGVEAGLAEANTLVANAKADLAKGAEQGAKMSAAAAVGKFEAIKAEIPKLAKAGKATAKKAKKKA
jgi:hypothetical protein